jgi:hypothetical protein
MSTLDTLAGYADAPTQKIAAMIRPVYSYLLAGLLPDARIKIYPDSAHGFLFQHHRDFAADVNAFLGEAN